MSKVSLGQYYTPAPLATWMVSLAQSEKDARILEPSCGEGVFLDALKSQGYGNIAAFEIDSKVAEKAAAKHKEVVKQNFLLAPLKERYDLIIGNPPYVKWGNIPAQSKKVLTEDSFWKNISSGEWDLLYAFLVGSAKMLVPGGEMIFIVPCNWFSATYARPVREYLLSRGYFSDLIDFGEQRVFKDAAPNAAVFRWQKSPSSKKVRVIYFQGRADKNFLSEAEDLRQGLIKGKEQKKEGWRSFFAKQPTDPWHFSSGAEDDFCQKVEAFATEKLSSLASVGVGMVSGLDKAFMLESAKGFTAAEKKFIFPFVKARDCKHFYLSRPSYFIWADAVESEGDLKKLKNIYSHLLGHKKDLLARYGNSAWWRWATVRNEDLFRKNLRRPKIFLPCTDRAEQARFSISKNPYFASGDVLMIAAKGDPYLLAAWLGSKTFNQWYSVKGPKTGQRRRYPQSFLETVPVAPENKLSSRDKEALIANCKKMARGENLITANELIWKKYL